MPESCKPSILTRLGVSAIAVLVLAGAALGAPCKGEVTIGDGIEEVADNCGAATLKDHRELWEEEIGEKGTTRSSSVIDEWTFDAGPEELMRGFVFRDGKLSEIRSMGYGRSRDPLEDTCRNGESLAVGDSILDAYLKCGEPLAKEKRADKVTESVVDGHTRRSAVPVAEWTYRYGPDLPGYTMRFENGQATLIRAREFGK